MIAGEGVPDLLINRGLGDVYPKHLKNSRKELSLGRKIGFVYQLPVTKPIFLGHEKSGLGESK